MSKEQVAIKTVYFSIVSNACLALIKWLAGYFGNSYALIADAIESTSDIFSSILVLFGLKYATKPADKNHPYGHGKAEPLITFLVVAFLVASALIIAYNSLINICTPHEPPKVFTLYILAAIIIWKEGSYQWVIRKSRKTNSSALKADAWHHRSDAITSVAAFIGISIAIFCGKGFESADDWAALLASALILYNSYHIFRPALGEVMDEQLYDDYKEKIKIIAKTVDGVIDTEKCYIRKAGMMYHVDLHISVKGMITVSQGHTIAHRLNDTLHEQMPELGKVLIHVEPDFMNQ